MDDDDIDQDIIRQRITGVSVRAIAKARQYAAKFSAEGARRAAGGGRTEKTSSSSKIHEVTHNADDADHDFCSPQQIAEWDHVGTYTI
jgi:hypothetical protein